MNLQRFYNILCRVYGSQPAESEWMEEYFPDLEDRVAGGRCEAEYQDQKDARGELLSPWYQ